MPQTSPWNSVKENHHHIALLFIPDAATASQQALAILTLGSLGPGTLGVLIFFSGLRRIPAAHTAVLSLIEPFVAIVIAILLMKEQPNLFTLIGATGILAGAAIVVTSSAPPSHPC